MGNPSRTTTQPNRFTQPALVIGVDIGGTKVAAGLVDERGMILHQARVPMVADRGADVALEAVRTAIDSVASDARLHSEAYGIISAIGICCPGPLNPNTGIIINPPNLPCWRDFPLTKEISRIYGVNVKVDNDGNAAALAEALWGAGRGYPNVFLATIGTGIGTGIVMEGQIYHGRTGAAGEGGHLSIDYRGPRCGCGKLGCIEALASGPAIANRARTKLAAGDFSALIGLCGGKVDLITSEMIGTAYASGDPVAKQTLEETVELLSVWLGNIIDLLEPDIMIMGGGCASLLEPFFPQIQARLPECCVNSRCQEIPLVMARFGEDAGIVGGAAFCAQNLRIRA